MFAKRFLRRLTLPLASAGTLNWALFESNKPPKSKFVGFFKPEGTTNYESDHTFPITAHPVHPVFEQSLADWAEKSTQSFQLLEFAPRDLMITVAFLRLLGIERASLRDIGRERGGMNCFVSHLLLVEDARPVVIQSAEDLFNSIDEFRSDSLNHLRPLFQKVLCTIAHIKPSTIDNANIILHTNALEVFYLEMAQLSDDNIDAFATYLLKEDNEPAHKRLLIANLQKARSLCQAHIASRQNDHDATQGAPSFRK